MKKAFSIFAFMLFFVTVAFTQQKIQVFKPDICQVIEMDTVYEFNAIQQYSFGFDFENNLLYISTPNEDLITEKMMDYSKTKWSNDYTTINWTTSTAHYELWLFPNDDSVILQPQQLFEFPVGGPVNSKQYYRLSREEK